MNRRRQTYIPGSFQRKFVAQFCGIVLAGCALFGGVLYLYSSRTLTTAFFHSRLRVMSTADFLLPALGATAVVVAALAALAAALRLLVLSHKIAGPLYRLEKAAEALGKGDLSQRVTLRQGDELKSFAKSMDSAVAEMRLQVEQVRRGSRAVQEALEKMRKDPATSSQFMEELQQAQAEMDRALGRFKV